MASDHVAVVEAAEADAEPAAYISPVADFLLLAAVTTAVALAGAAVMVP